MTEEFSKEAKIRELKIKILNDNITKMNQHLLEEKTSQFYEQKRNQLETM